MIARGRNRTPGDLRRTDSKFDGSQMPAKPRTVRQREAERRRQKLEDMRQQIEAGTLTVRRMTPAERERHPPPERPRPKRWTRGYRL
jgi:hypothetical protein